MSNKMMMEAVVSDVELRKVQKRDGSGEMSLYDVVVSDGTKWTAFERELAERAHKLKGIPALLEVTVQQNGSFTNRNLRNIQAKTTDGFSPALSAMEAQIGNGSSQPAPFPILTEQQSPSAVTFTPAKPLVEEPSYKDRTIWRQTAGKVSAVISKTEAEFWQNCDHLVRYFETGEKPNAASATATSAGDPFDDLQQPSPIDNIPF